MRVLCFGRFCDAQPGGIQAHVQGLLTALRDQVEFVNLVPSRDFRGSRFLLPGGIPVIRTPSWNVDGSLALSPGLVLEAWRQHRMRPFDLVHLHFPDPMSHLASMAIPARVPRLVTWHADVVRQQQLLRLYRPWLNRLLRQAGAIVVATPAHFSSSPLLSGLDIQDKLQVIPFCFDLERFLEPDPRAFQIRNAHPGRLIFALGRHVSYKGFDVLLQAMAALDPDVRLLLGGEGPLTDALKGQAVALGLENRVVFLGLVPDEELPAYYQACDVFCLPSVTQAEAFGIVQVEAMAAGRPVVSTRLNNGVDFVNQHGVTGLCVPPGDSAALAQALSHLLNQEELRREMGACGRRRALAEFQLEQMGDRTLALYQRLVADSVARGRHPVRPQ